MRLRSVLAHSGAYAFFQNLVGARAFRSAFVASSVRPRPGDRVLDIGCGTGDVLEFLPDVDYWGMDVSADYVRRGARKFGRRGRFLCADALTSEVPDGGRFDVVLAMGVLHHLPDADVLRLLTFARTALKAGGRVTTFDGCYDEGQSRVARYLVSKDRGQHVRTTDHYRKLASRVFSNVRSRVAHGRLRIPYTHLIMEMSQTSPAEEL